MAVKIGHASIDERGQARGGKAGDQTGREVCTRDWYTKGWNCLIRPKNKKVAKAIATAMEQACANDNIGYDQNYRTTLYSYAVAARWDLSKIKCACETDCSALVAVCVNCAGIRVSKDMYTGNEEATLRATGHFDILKDAKYLTSSDYLKRGDILLMAGHHTAVVLSDGPKAGGSTKKSDTKSGNPYTMPTALIKKGSKGEGVKWVQYELNESGAALVIDGIAGAKTDAAIRKFQKANGLEVDGIVGKNTRAKLKAK